MMGFIGKFSTLDSIAIAFNTAAQAMSTARSRAAARIQADARRDHASGESPDGVVWKRRKKDNALAMQRPGQTVRYFVRRTELVGIAEDVFQWHDKTRPVFPANGIPADWITILDEEHVIALNKHFEEPT